MLNTAKTIGFFLQTMRPHQWVKNIFIFAPMLFSGKFFNPSYIEKSSVTFFLFSLVAGCIYVFNDTFDKEKDSSHPDKKKRPIASGRLKTTTAVISGIILLTAALTFIYFFNTYFFYITLIYVGMNIFYSGFLKHVVILDVLIIAVGFVLRVEIGGVVNHIAIYPWILIITFLLAVFLGLIKRRQEFIKIEINSTPQSEGQTRKSLKQYNLSLLDQLISITTATTIISYIIYTVQPDVMHKFGSDKLYLTIPFMVFAIFRYLYLTYVKGKGESPSEVIFSDLPFTLSGLLWVGVFISLIYF